MGPDADPEQADPLSSEDPATAALLATFYFRCAETLDVTGEPALPWYLYVHGTALSAWILVRFCSQPR
jgi:hypothetical protein